MSHIRMKLTVAALALIGAVGYLGWAGIRDGWVYYVHVDQFVMDTTYHDQRVRVHGLVSPENFQVGHDQIERADQRSP